MEKFTAINTYDYLTHFKSDWDCKGTVVNRAMIFLHRGPLKITLTVPLRRYDTDNITVWLDEGSLHYNINSTQSFNSNRFNCFNNTQSFQVDWEMRECSCKLSGGYDSLLRIPGSKELNINQNCSDDLDPDLCRQHFFFHFWIKLAIKIFLYLQ